MKHALPLVFLMPLAAYAEVMDKEWSIASLCCWAVGSAAFAFLAARYRPWLTLGLLLPMALFAAQLMEVTSTDVGPAIAKEAGTLYIAVSWAAPFLVLASGFLGVWLRRRAAPNNSFKPRPLRGSA